MERASRDAAETVEVVTGVRLTQLAAGERMSVQYVAVDPDSLVPEHSHPHEQAGYVVEGTFTFLIDDEEIRVSEGDAYVVPASVPHAVGNPGEVTAGAIDIFSPPRANPDWGE